MPLSGTSCTSVHPNSLHPPHLPDGATEARDPRAYPHPTLLARMRETSSSTEPGATARSGLLLLMLLERAR